MEKLEYSNHGIRWYIYIFSGFFPHSLVKLGHSFSLLRLYTYFSCDLKYSLTNFVSAIIFTLTPNFDFSSSLLITISGHILVEIRISLLQYSIHFSSFWIALSNDMIISILSLVLSEIAGGIFT